MIWNISITMSVCSICKKQLEQATYSSRTSWKIIGRVEEDHWQGGNIPNQIFFDWPFQIPDDWSTGTIVCERETMPHWIGVCPGIWSVFEPNSIRHNRLPGLGTGQWSDQEYPCPPILFVSIHIPVVVVAFCTGKEFEDRNRKPREWTIQTWSPRWALLPFGKQTIHGRSRVLTGVSSMMLSLPSFKRCLTKSRHCSISARFTYFSDFSDGTPSNLKPLDGTSQSAKVL